MTKHEHLIFYSGRYYIGKIRDYMDLCVLKPSTHCGLRRATPEDAELYGIRMGQSIEAIQKAKKIIETHNYKDGL